MDEPRRLICNILLGWIIPPRRATPGDAIRLAEPTVRGDTFCLLCPNPVGGKLRRIESLGAHFIWPGGSSATLGR